MFISDYSSFFRYSMLISIIIIAIILLFLDMIASTGKGLGFSAFRRATAGGETEACAEIPTTRPGVSFFLPSLCFGRHPPNWLTSCVAGFAPDQGIAVLGSGSFILHL